MMTAWMLLAAAAAPGGQGAQAAFQACIAETTRVAAHAGRVPEELPVLLHDGCAAQRARLVDKAPDVARPAANARADEVTGSYLRRYAIFYTTGMWPKR